MKSGITLFIFLMYNALSAQDNSAIGITELEKNSFIKQIQEIEPQYYKKPSAYLAIKLAQAYHRIKNYEKAIYYNELAIQMDSSQSVYYAEYFNILLEFGENETARKVATLYRDKFFSDQFVNMLDSSEHYAAQEANYEVEPLNSNTKYDEYGMYSLFNGFRIVNSNIIESATDARPTIGDLTTSLKSYVSFYSETDKTASNYFRLYTRKNGTYDVISCYDPIEKKVYITSNVTKAFNENGKYSNTANLKILIADVDTNLTITNFKEFPHNSDEYSVGQPSVSNDGELLYFISNKPGGFGGSDIYMCVKLLDGSWGAPVNLGKEINTSEDELFPYVSPAGALYFSSRGHSLLGGMDIVKSYKSRSNTFSKVQNLGSPINSNRDDFAFNFLDKYGTQGFFSSNRSDGAGGADIYKFNFFSRKVCKDPIKNFMITVRDKKTKEPVSNVYLKMTIRADGRILNGTTNEQGNLELLVEGCNDFDVEATHDFYLNNGFYYDGFKKQVNIELDKKELNNIVELESIYYDVGKFDLNPVSQQQIMKLQGLLARNTDIKIELSSHTDSRGDDASNQILSQKRAETILNFLVNAGINKGQLFAQGYGETRLLNDCGNNSNCTEYQHGQNRRTEFKIIEISGKSVNISRNGAQPMEQPKVNHVYDEDIENSTTQSTKSDAPATKSSMSIE